MKTYKLTKTNITRFVGENYYVVFEIEHERKNIKILSKVFGSGGCVPKIQIGENVYSPYKISIADAKANGLETFSI